MKEGSYKDYERVKIEKEKAKGREREHNERMRMNMLIRNYLAEKSNLLINDYLFRGNHN